VEPTRVAQRSQCCIGRGRPKGCRAKKYKTAVVKVASGERGEGEGGGGRTRELRSLNRTRLAETLILHSPASLRIASTLARRADSMSESLASASESVAAGASSMTVAVVPVVVPEAVVAAVRGAAVPEPVTVGALASETGPLDAAVEVDPAVTAARTSVAAVASAGAVVAETAAVVVSAAVVDALDAAGGTAVAAATGAGAKSMATRMLSSLTSRWTMPWRCMWRMASTSCSNMDRATRGWRSQARPWRTNGGGIGGTNISTTMPGNARRSALCQLNGRV